MSCVLCLVSCVFFTHSYAQFSVTATAGTTGPTAYTSLTLANGVFAAINAGTHKGVITVSVTGNSTSETGATALNASGSGSASYTSVSIVPSTNSLFTISGTTTGNTPLFNFNGTGNITINGTYSSASDQYLLFRNTNPAAGNAGAAILFTNSATNCTISNCIIESNETSAAYGAGVIGTGTNTGITISNNDIRSATGGTVGAYANGIYTNNSNNVLTITGNSFYSASAGTTAQTAINLASAGSGNSINHNFIGGQAAGCSGSPWTNSYNGLSYGIYLSAGTASASEVAGNTIKNFTLSGTTNAGFYGINVAAGLVNVGVLNAGGASGNIIGDPSVSNSIQTTAASTGALYGIKVASAVAVNNVSNNTIAGITTASASSSSFIGIGITAGTASASSLMSNIVKNITVGGTGAFTGINLGAGYFNVGTVSTPNIIGDASTTNSINCSKSSGSAAITGINSTSATNVNITGNLIANITGQEQQQGKSFQALSRLPLLLPLLSTAILFIHSLLLMQLLQQLHLWAFHLPQLQLLILFRKIQFMHYQILQEVQHPY